MDVAQTALAAKVLLGHDENAADWIAAMRALESVKQAAPSPAEVGRAAVADEKTAVAESGPATAVERLARAIETGNADAAPALVDEVIRDGMPPERVIAEVLTPAIQGLGDAFGRGEAFLPQLMVGADAMKAAVGRVRTHLPEMASSAEGRVVFATVKGDIHSIGKDICVSLLESQGFEVNDLGVDVDAQRILESARESDVVCLSALMTTTLPSMETTARSVAEEAGVPVLVGGAVVTEEWATSIGAGFSADAPGCVAAVREAIGRKRT
jgi:5-methyltetrahydrofolate--homocysteine methyltransferase